MLQVVLIQPGSTDFDEQRRIKGSLDIPLSIMGTDQVSRTVEELASYDIDTIYCSPCQSAVQTAQILARDQGIRFKRRQKLKNLDHGLWHGMLIDEVRYRQPKVYRRCQDDPQTVCPPEGESVASAQQRVRSVLAKITKKYKQGTVAIIVSEPLASLVRGELQQRELGDFWSAEQDCGGWTLINVEPNRVPVAG